MADITTITKGQPDWHLPINENFEALKDGLDEKAAAQHAAQHAMGGADELTHIAMGFGVSLWGGSANEGDSIVLPGVRDYRWLIIGGQYATSVVLARVQSAITIAGGGVLGAYGWQFHRTVGITLSADNATTDTWTVTQSQYMDHTPSGAHGAFRPNPITGIWGIIR